jgi:hypothetical protein
MYKSRSSFRKKSEKKYATALRAGHCCITTGQVARCLAQKRPFSATPGLFSQPQRCYGLLKYPLSGKK